MIWQAKIDLTTGDLIAFGYSDFGLDDSFDPMRHEIVSEHQIGLKAKNPRRITPFHRWADGAWLLVDLSLDDLKRKRIKELAAETSGLMRKHYPKERFDSLGFILEDAVFRNLQNRATHIRSKNAWGIDVLQFYTDQRSTIEALTTFADVYAYTWDFSSIMEVDPVITISSALAIVN